MKTTRISVLRGVLTRQEMARKIAHLESELTASEERERAADRRVARANRDADEIVRSVKNVVTYLRIHQNERGLQALRIELNLPDLSRGDVGFVPINDIVAYAANELKQFLVHTFGWGWEHRKDGYEV